MVCVFNGKKRSFYSKIIVMKYFLVPLILLFSLLSAVQGAIAEPSISFEDMTHDFGDVSQGDLLEHAFVFTNDGTDTLVIEKVTAS